MQKFSDPVQHCSTTVGRVLFELFCTMEDYCCVLAAYKALLPAEWRRENVRIRQLLAHEEYPRVTPEERKPRLLDDLWAQLWALCPALTDIVSTVPLLKTLEGQERIDVAAHLMRELRHFMRDWRGFLASPHVVEILLPAPSTPLSFCYKHAHCCPPLPFTPELFTFPPAGFLRVKLLCIEMYIRETIYPLLRAELGPDEVIVELSDENVTSVEVCRSYAGLEHYYADNPDFNVPCFTPLVLTALSCPPSLRPWLWCKLVHAEDLGLRFESIKQNLAQLWDMPEILTEGFSLFQGNSLHRPISGCDDVEIKVNTRNVKEEEEEETGFDNSDLESLTQLWGLFGIQNEWENSYL